jgi:hypothetical protein
MTFIIYSRNASGILYKTKAGEPILADIIAGLRSLGHTIQEISPA